jgi:hypothetical protein
MIDAIADQVQNLENELHRGNWRRLSRDDAI